eukprot:scaffold10861_cov180-Amphora_coffeaeformis.AAC.4
MQVAALRLWLKLNNPGWVNHLKSLLDIFHLAFVFTHFLPGYFTTPVTGHSPGQSFASSDAPQRPEYSSNDE